MPTFLGKFKLMTQVVSGWVIEDAIQVFLVSWLYVKAREQLTNNLQFLDSILIGRI
jgi:hypothetical protein